MSQTTSQRRSERRVTPEELSCPLAHALAADRVHWIHAPEGRYALVRGIAGKLAVEEEGWALASRIWTLRELESLPWDGPLTLEAVAKAFAPAHGGAFPKTVSSLPPVSP
jgi:hypothetical protein